ncbi:MAG: NlpC/P60 family protein [bacterium]|nr:NlpC/P60 family protein [bacterium]
MNYRIEPLTDDERAMIIAEARTWIGAPYKKWGADKSGVDCSMFSILVNRAATSHSPSLCDWLFLLSTVIPTDGLREGDLVFFRPTEGIEPPTRLATHVGIYIGNGQIIHASKDGVKAEKLSDVTNRGLEVIEEKDEIAVFAFLLYNDVTDADAKEAAKGSPPENKTPPTE